MLTKQELKDLFQSELTEEMDLDPSEVLNSIDVQKLIENHKPDHKETNYERIQLFENSIYELVFCHWKSKGMSQVHNHSDLDCWFRCIEGVLTEERESLSNGVQEISSSQRIIGVNDCSENHQILNKTKSCAYSIHLYKKKK